MEITEIVAIIVVIVLIGGLIGIAIYNNSRECLSYHEEQYIELPPTMNLGGGQYGGGIGLPIGQGIIKTKQVCDKYAE